MAPQCRFACKHTHTHSAQRHSPSIRHRIYCLEGCAYSNPNAYSITPPIAFPLPCKQEEHERGNIVGVDVSTGEALDPVAAGIYDNFIVKRQIIQSAPIITSQLLLVDEVIRAGMNMRKK